MFGFDNVLYILYIKDQNKIIKTEVSLHYKSILFAQAITYYMCLCIYINFWIIFIDCLSF